MRAADYFQRRRAARDSAVSGPSQGLPEASSNPARQRLEGRKPGTARSLLTLLTLGFRAF